MSKYFISLLIAILPILSYGQSKPVDLNPKDTVEYKQEYGLRVGADISRLVFSFIDEDYTGLELVGDYRLTQKLYLAAELGNEEKTQTEGLGNTLLYNYTTSGSYIKAGVDLNTYENWFGMNNAIILGGRYAVASFNQTLNEYNVFDSNRQYSPDTFLPGAQPGEEFSGLSASWLELVVGIKAELFANIFVGMSARLGFLVTNKEDGRFPNLWIPGFNKVTDGSNFGVGYNYSISYFIPFYKKSKKKKVAEEIEQ
ncbi:MAG: DUF6048 family protein [Allomuricauda sp.]